MDSAGASTSAAGVGGDGGGGMAGPPPLIAGWIAGVGRRYQHYLDKSTPHVLRRWLAFGALAAAYVVRVFVLQGFYLVSYALAIYVLSLVIAFLSPQADPAFEGLGGEDDDEEAGPLLPVRGSDEFRPFVRRLPEFKLWYSITKAFCIAFLMTFFVVFDVPVFWPILFFYWLMLFVLTMKRQIKHMIKYRYVPFSFGKQQYGKKPAPVGDAAPAED